MNELFLKMTGGLAVVAFVATFAVALLITHASFAIAKCRHAATTRYRPFMKKWLVRRGLPSALLLTLLVLLLAIGPATFLAWYRTRSLHQLPGQHLVLRVHDHKNTPMDDGGYSLEYEVTHTTTNAAEITELLEAIRFSPTYPNFGCLCSGGRKFEIAYVSQDGHEWPRETFTVPHDQSVRFQDDWYGDWHLWKGSQHDIAAWQEKFLENQERSNK
jgi:hypothetical protein